MTDCLREGGGGPQLCDRVLWEEEGDEEMEEVRDAVGTCRCGRCRRSRFSEGD